MIKSKKDVKIIMRYSEALKRKISDEISRGLLTPKEASLHYGIKHSRTITGWVRQYSPDVQETKVVRVMMKSEQERIRDLEKLVTDLELKSMVFAAQLKSYEGYVPELKKKLNTKELKQFERNEKKIADFR